MTVVATYFSDNYSGMVSDCHVKADSDPASPVTRITEKIRYSVDEKSALAVCGSEVVAMAIDGLRAWSQQSKMKIDYFDSRFIENLIECSSRYIQACERSIGQEIYKDDSFVYLTSMNGVSLWPLPFGRSTHKYYSNRRHPIPGKIGLVEVRYGGRYESFPNISHSSSLLDVFESLKQSIIVVHSDAKSGKKPYDALPYEFDNIFCGFVVDRRTGASKRFLPFDCLSNEINASFGGAANFNAIAGGADKWNPTFSG